MENYGNMSPEEMSAALFRSLGAFGARGKCLLISVVTLLFSFFLIIPIFWCLRADKTVSWDWAVVFIPMWVIDAIYYCCLGCMSVSSDASMDPEDKKNQRPALYKLYKFLKALLLLVLQIFVAMKLNGDVNWSVREVLIPYFVYDSLSFVEGIVGGIVGYKMLTKESEGAGVSATEAIKKQRKQLVVAVGVQLLLIASRLTQGALLGLKIDDQLNDASWWLVFIPVWLYISYFVSIPVNRYFKAKAKAKEPKSSEPRQEAHDAYTRESVNEDEESVSKHPFADLLCSVVFIGVIASPYFLLAARLQDGGFSAFYVLLPWYIIVSCSAVAFCRIKC